MKFKFLLSVLAFSFCLVSVSYAGGDAWTELQKTIRRNKADTPEGAAARNRLAQARMTDVIGDDVITLAQTVRRLREVIDALGADTHYGALARCNLVLMWVDGRLGAPGVSLSLAIRLLGEVIRQQGVGTGQAVAARFLLVRMRLMNEIDDRVYTPQALIAFMREVVDNYHDPVQRDRQVANAQARIRDLELLIAPPPAGDTGSEQEREAKKTKVCDEETERVRIAQIDARLNPVVPFPPPLTIDNNNNFAAQNNAGAVEELVWGTPERTPQFAELFFGDADIAVDYGSISLGF